jgi:hypothetical protein
MAENAKSPVIVAWISTRTTLPLFENVARS